MFFDFNLNRPVAFALSFFVLTVCAQSDREHLRLPDALRLLLSEHPSLLSRRAELAATQEGVDVARRQFWPTPSISADSGPKNWQGKNSALTARLSVPVYTGGQLTADLDVAQLHERLAQTDIEKTARDLTLQFVAAYRSWWFHTSRMDVLNNSHDRMTSLNAMMQKRSRAGVSSRLEAQQADMQRMRFWQDLQLAMLQRDAALAEMSSLLGQPLTLQFESLQDLFGQSGFDLNSLIDKVMRTDPKLAAADISHALALAEVRKFKAATLPTVTLRADKQYGSYLGAQEPGTRIYLNSQLSLGAGLASLPMIKQSSARAQAAQDQVHTIQRDLRTQVTSLWHEQQQAQEQRTGLASQLETQNLLVDAGLRLFHAGRRSWQDLLSLLREQHQLQLQLTEADASFLSSRLRIQIMADTLHSLSFSSL